jgi:SAM-dependent methyltransferase
VVTHEHPYVLGTHDEELARLGLQHRVWRPRALDAWRRGGFTVGQTLFDIGCGPGYASLDLADIVGTSGRVIAIDQSQRYLDALKAAARKNISTYKLDLDADELPRVTADGAWVRWVFGFLKHPRALLERIAGILRPGATLVVHEYFDYGTWRFTRRSPLFEEFVATVMRSWRASGGEPDVGLDLSIWAEEVGFRVASLIPIIDVISPSNFVWQWPKTFTDVGLRRLIELGDMSEEGAAAIRNEFRTLEAMPHTKIITPGVLEIIAVKE